MTGSPPVMPAAQLTMAFSSLGDPGAIRKARETALLTKFLTVGRLSKEEREEIAHIIGHPAEPMVEKVPPPMVTAPAAPATVTRGADDYEHIKIGRRTYFRWLKFGKQLPEGPDLPPFDEPHLLPAWYERMRQRGIFKHRFPDEIADAIAAHTAGGETATNPGKETPPSTPSKAATGAPTPAPSQQVPTSFGADHGLASGLQYEVAAEQQRVASLRVARDEAYFKGEKDNGDTYDRRYREALDALSLVQARAIKIGEQEARLVPIEMIEQEFAPRLNAIVQGGLLLWDGIGPALMDCPDHATRRMMWKKKWIEFCTGLRTDRFRFAPPLELS